ncbi:MAG: type II secretion system protein [Limnohabitans sp.]|nr:MAG: type II secretion system protein [Limnohabitans sp.]
MTRRSSTALKGFLLMELALALVIFGGLAALLIPLMSMQSKIDTASKDKLAMQSAVDALLRQSVVASGLPGPIQFAEADAGGTATASSHSELSPSLTVLPLGWAGALPGQLLGVPTVSPLQTAYWYDVQPALRSDASKAFQVAVVQSDTTWGFRSIVEQLDPDINPNMSSGGLATQLCRNLNTLQAIEQGIRAYPSDTSTDYKRNYINATLPRIWTSGYESHFAWDVSTGYANNTPATVDAVFENSSAAAFVVVRRQPPALRRLDRQNAVYPQFNSTGLDAALADRGTKAYPAEATSGLRGFRVYENPLTPPFDNPTSDTQDYDGLVKAVSLNEFADQLRQSGMCSAPAASCKINQLYVRFSNYVNAITTGGSTQGMTLRWELMDRDPSRTEDVLVQSGDISHGSTSSGMCIDAFATNVATQPNTRYLRVSFISPTGAVGYTDGALPGYWYRGGIFVDPNGNNPAANDGVTRWRNRTALSAAEAGKTVTIACTGSHTLTAANELNRAGPSLPSCTVTQLP